MFVLQDVGFRRIVSQAITCSRVEDLWRALVEQELRLKRAGSFYYADWN